MSVPRTTGNRFFRLAGLGLVLLLIAVPVLALAGCGDDEPEATTSPSAMAGSGVEEAAALVASGESEPTFELTEAFPEKPQSGQTVMYISVLLGIPFSQELVKGFKEGMTAAGNEVIVSDANGSVQEGARLIDQAINQKVSAIVIQSISSDALSAPIQAAKKAGIPVIELFEANPGLPTAEQEAIGVFGNVSFDFAYAGQLQAAWVVADSGGQGHGMIITAPDSGVSGTQTDAMYEVFKTMAPDFEVDLSKALQAQWATKIPQLTQAALRDPTIDYIMPIYDGMATYVTPEIAKQNAQDRVKVNAINANVPQMKQLAAGDIITSLVGQPLNWIGWGIADQTLRATNGLPPVADELIGQRMFTEKNIGDIDVNADQGTWFGDTDYKAAYLELWGLN